MRDPLLPLASAFAEASAGRPATMPAGIEAAQPSSAVDEASCLVCAVHDRPTRAPSRPSRFKLFSHQSKPPRMARISRMTRIKYFHPCSSASIRGCTGLSQTETTQPSTASGPSHEAGRLVHPPSPSLRRASPQPHQRLLPSLKALSPIRVHWCPFVVGSVGPPKLARHHRALRGSITRAQHHGHTDSTDQVHPSVRS